MYYSRMIVILFNTGLYQFASVISILLVRGKFSFLYVDIWFDVTKCKSIGKNSSFKVLLMFSPVFVADTKTTFVYNFVAPLTQLPKATQVAKYHVVKIFDIFILTTHLSNTEVIYIYIHTHTHIYLPYVCMSI